MLELMNEDRVAEMKVRSRGVKPRFDPQRTVLFDGTSQFLFQLVRLNNFNNPSTYQFQLLCYRRHRVPLCRANDLVLVTRT